MHRRRTLLIVEILTYQLDGESDDDYAAVFPRLVADSAELAVECGAKVFKLQYPGSAEACAAVTAVAACHGRCCQPGSTTAPSSNRYARRWPNGASGAMAGRSLWKDSLAVSHETRNALLAERARPRLAELQAAVDGADSLVTTSR
jgi:sulfofructosephosphate aldolase